MKTSDTTREIFSALVKAQSQITHAPKNAENPFYKSRYADLATVIDTARAPLHENGLAIMQTPSVIDGELCLTTRVIHTSGEWAEDTVICAMVKKDPQSAGSAITYYRRYSLAAILGIAQEDDDANSASTPAKEQPKPKGNIEKALAAIKTAADIKAVEGLKSRITLSSWTEQEEIMLDDAIKTRIQILKEAK